MWSIVTCTLSCGLLRPVLLGMSCGLSWPFTLELWSIVTCSMICGLLQPVLCGLLRPVLCSMGCGLLQPVVWTVVYCDLFTVVWRILIYIQTEWGRYCIRCAWLCMLADTGAWFYPLADTGGCRPILGYFLYNWLLARWHSILCIYVLVLLLMAPSCISY